MAESLIGIWLAWLAKHLSVLIKTILACSGAFAEEKLPAFRQSALSSSAARMRIAGNCILFLLWTLVVALFSAAVVYGLSKTELVRLGLLRQTDWPEWVKIGLAIGLLDLTSYGVHRLEHSVPLFWRFHSVHHSDRHLDLSTTIRKHPLSGLYTSAFFLIVILGFGIAPAEVAAYNIAADVVGFFAHSSLDFPQALNRAFRSVLLIAPDDHKIHHSELRQETDSNYGQVFSVWDRCFGTFRKRSDLKSLRFGLGNALPEKLGVFPRTLLAPFLQQSLR